MVGDTRVVEACQERTPKRQGIAGTTPGDVEAHQVPASDSSLPKGEHVAGGGVGAPTWQADSDDGAAVILDCLFEVDEHLQVVNQDGSQVRRHPHRGACFRRYGHDVAMGDGFDKRFKEIGANCCAAEGLQVGVTDVKLGVECGVQFGPQLGEAGGLNNLFYDRRGGAAGVDVLVELFK